jgi:hypothetical protein
MLSQLLNQMDKYLANKPFMRPHWWSRRWIVYMTIEPPLRKDKPLWKRSQAQLRLLRLCGLSPEELGQKIERYWKKPRWQRWFASFGMNKKIDVWNYYQRCVAYQKISQDKPIPEQSLVIASESRPILEDLGLVLHQSNVKFETYLEKRCRNLQWVEKYFSEEVKRYMQRLKKTFATKLSKHLKRIETEGERLAIKQQVEKEYQQVEALMFHYYHLWRCNTFSSLPHPNAEPEVGIDVAHNENVTSNPERSIAIYRRSQNVSSPSQSVESQRVIRQTGIASLNDAKEWIQAQRQCLNSLIEEGSLQKVEALLQTSLNEIKTITELHLDPCGTTLFNIQGKHQEYDVFLECLDDLQRRLKPLLQGGLRLFHPDHVMNLTHSQAMWEMITRYSQFYLEQSRYYLDSLKNYHLRIEDLYHQSQQQLQRQQELQDWSDLARRIQELGQSIKELEQSFKELDKKRTEDIERFQERLYAKLEQDKAEIRAVFEQNKAKIRTELEQDKAERNAKLEEIEAKIRTQIKTKFEQGIEKANKNADDTHINEQATSISDSAEKLINRLSF